KQVSVKSGEVKSLWCGVTIPRDIPNGRYQGEALISPANATSTTVTFELEVRGEILANRGIDKPWKQTRLTWLNSTLAKENEIIKPYMPLEVAGDTISLLGRRLILAEDGLPAQIQTFFTERMTTTSDVPNPILKRPLRFHI